MEVSIEVHKIIQCTIYSTILFFTSGGDVDDVLLRLPLIEKIIKDTNLMSISFIQCQTSTDISGIVNEFVQYDQNYFQYVYIPI